MNSLKNLPILSIILLIRPYEVLISLRPRSGYVTAAFPERSRRVSQPLQTLKGRTYKNSTITENILVPSCKNKNRLTGDMCGLLVNQKQPLNEASYYGNKFNIQIGFFLALAVNIPVFVLPHRQEKMVVAKF
ncbi:MAG: hypothetical protein ABL933_18970 [Methyloglobulus sp.]|nr:hypothetical protein [Methyloglobulus sp.]